MKQLLLAALLAATPTIAMTANAAEPAATPAATAKEAWKADCRAAWKQAGSKELDAEKAKPFVTNFADVDKNGDQKITHKEFVAGCRSGAVKTAAHNPAG